MVPECARLAVSVASLHPSLHHFELIETFICLVAGNNFFISEVWW
jgi:hypothetical protein